jgi:hypothetical protein
MQTDYQERYFKNHKAWLRVKGSQLWGKQSGQEE